MVPAALLHLHFSLHYILETSFHYHNMYLTCIVNKNVGASKMWLYHKMSAHVQLEARRLPRFADTYPLLSCLFNQYSLVNISYSQQELLDFHNVQTEFSTISNSYRIW